MFTWFNNLKIIFKICVPVALLAALSVGLTALALVSMKSMVNGQEEIGNASDQMVLTSRANTSLINYARLIQRMPLSTKPEDRAAVMEEAGQELEVFRKRTAELQAMLVEDDERANLAKAVGIADQLEIAAHKTADFFSKSNNAAAYQVLMGTLPLVNEARDIMGLIMADSDENLVAASANAKETAVATRWTMLLLGAVGVVSGIAIALVLAILGISRPLTALNGVTRQLAGGDNTVTVVGVERSDEIGEMAKAVQVFKENALEMERLRAEQQEAEQRAEAEKRRAMNELADHFSASIGGVVEAVATAATEMQATAESMAATAEETSRQSTTVAAASEQASANVQTVASAAEELSGSIGEISRQVSESTRITGLAVEEAEQTNGTVKGLSEAAQKIGEVVNLINDIASQTNLLALNATIEAARAGEAGKGFAVVASEVKSLANQTAKATEEIAAQISAMQTETDKSVGAIEKIGGIIAQISEIATTIASAVEEQGAATQEIARNVQQAASGTGQVSTNIAGVTQAAGETGAAASQVLATAGQLSQEAEKLRAQVDGFLNNIRAA